MGLWASVFAAVYDRGMAAAERAGLAELRQQLLARASGRVVEVGGGTGANLPFYTGAVSEVVVTEPEPAMAGRLVRKLDPRRFPVRVIRASAEQLPLESGTFDCAVSTLVLCTVRDPARALAEIGRVLKPHGTLLLLEHVRSEEPVLARWQDALATPFSWVACGCRCNRRTLDSVARAGFRIADLRRDEMPLMPRIIRPLVVAAATNGTGARG